MVSQSSSPTHGSHGHSVRATSSSCDAINEKVQRSTCFILIHFATVLSVNTRSRRDSVAQLLIAWMIGYVDHRLSCLAGQLDVGQVQGIVGALNVYRGIHRNASREHTSQASLPACPAYKSETFRRCKKNRSMVYADEPESRRALSNDAIFLRCSSPQSMMWSQNTDGIPAELWCRFLSQN